MLERILADAPAGLLIWAHGDHPAARALAASHQLTAVRTLLQLRREVKRVGPVETSPAQIVGEVSTGPTRFDAFRIGTDEEAWIALNAHVFSSHPEQGSVTRADLVQLEDAPWFDSGDFIVARDGDRMVGYCWLKIEEQHGEIYVIGVDPSHQGTGLGRSLMAAGYARLAARGVGTVSLYVEGDNVAALALYRSLDFVDHSVDIQYRASR